MNKIIFLISLISLISLILYFIIIITNKRYVLQEPYFNPVYQDEIIFNEIINFKSLTQLITNYNTQVHNNDNDCDCKLNLLHSNKIYDKLINKPFIENTENHNVINKYSPMLEKETYKITQIKKLKNGIGGRVYPENMSYSLFFTPRLERKALMMLNTDTTKYIYKDIDIVNCFPTISYYLCDSMNIKKDYISNYLKNRDTILNKIKEHYNITNADAKLYVLAILFGGTIDGIYKLLKGQWNINISHHKFIIEYEKECINLRNNIIAYLINFPRWETFLVSLIENYDKYDIISYDDNSIQRLIKNWNILGAYGHGDRELLKNTGNIKLTKNIIINKFIIHKKIHIKGFIWRIFSACENQIITKIYNYLTNDLNLSVDCIIHDGCLIRNYKDIDWNALIENIHTEIKKQMNIDIRIAYKNWNNEKMHPLFENNLKCENLSKTTDKKYLCDICCREKNTQISTPTIA